MPPRRLRGNSGALDEAGAVGRVGIEGELGHPADAVIHRSVNNNDSASCRFMPDPVPSWKSCGAPRMDGGLARR